MPRIFDNIDFDLLPALRSTLELCSRADFCVGYFNLRGWAAVADLVTCWRGTVDERCRLLVGMQRLPGDEFRLARGLAHDRHDIDNATARGLRTALAHEMSEQLTIGVPTDADREALLQLAEHLRSGRLVVKAHLRHPLHAKLYLCHRPDDPINPVIGYLGSSNFTMAGLRAQGELNVDVVDDDACAKLCRWFEDRWDDRFSLDIGDALVEAIETSWVRPVEPYHLYLKMAYHLSREARAGQSQYAIPKHFGAHLLDFQVAAVKIAAHHVNKRRGVMLGDVVGLGKTMMACAVASILESAPYHLETLVLCPPNLVPMWRDAGARHRLRMEVVPYSQAHKLAGLRRHRFLIIDESHNLRAGEGRRYSQIRDYIARNEPRVMLLSATPYNKHYSDLYHQLRLFVPVDQSLGVRPERLLEQEGADFGTLHQCQPDTLTAFGHSTFADDWRELMRLYLVRRTRSFIKENYARTDEAGRKYLTLQGDTPYYFPHRVPHTVRFEVDEQDPDDQYARLYSRAVVGVVAGLHLPRYGLANYLNENLDDGLSEADAEMVANLSRAGRRLMGFCRTNLFKRLESSGESFLLSVRRHIERNAVYLHAVQSCLPLPIGTLDAAQLDAAFNDGDVEGDDEVRANPARIYEHLGADKKIRWLRSDIFQARLKRDLEADCRAMSEVLAAAGAWDASRDRKLEKLAELLNGRHAGDKVLVFSQFADTVRYLEAELSRRGMDKLCAVTGDSVDPTALARRFSPRSNGREPAPDDPRVLLATDVLSEGQNLQDAHVVVNYDLPWAVIRLVQRAGRVDRIGQQSPEIACYSFYPAEGVERIIDLRGRLVSRLDANAEVLGTDERFFDDEQTSELRDLYNERARALEAEEDDREVDLASHAYQIWKNATEADPSLLEKVPALSDVVEGAKDRAIDSPPGALVYTRTAGDTDVLARVADDGRVLTQSQWDILQAAACSANTPARDLLVNHHELVQAGVVAGLESERLAASGLGRPSSPRYRAYHLLVRYQKAVAGTPRDTRQLHAVAAVLHQSPLQLDAADIIATQLKMGAGDEGMAQLLIDLHEEGRLVQDGSRGAQDAQPRLICSMGLV